MRPSFIVGLFFSWVPLLAAYSADWGDIATVSKTTAGYMCNYNGEDVNCGGNNPYVDASGNVSTSGYVTATAFFGDGSTLKDVTADDANTLDGLDSLQFLRSDVDDTYTGTLTLSGQLDATSLTVDTNTLFVDSTANRVGIGTGAPVTTLEIMGVVSATSYIGAIPSGAIAFFAETSCPSGWSEFTAARGLFVRGYGDSTNTYDPNGSTRTVGTTVQTESLLAHNHTASSSSVANHTHSWNPASFNETAASNGAHTHNTNPSTVTSSNWNQTHTHNFNPSSKTVGSTSAGGHSHNFSGTRITVNQGGGTGDNVTELANNNGGNTDKSTQSDGAHTHSVTVNIPSTTSGGTSVNHTHSVNVLATTSSSNGAHTHTVAVDVPATTTTAAGGHSHTITVNNDGGAETRPDNVALLFCQKD